MTAPSQQPMVQVRNVHRSFGANPILRGISMDIHRGEVVCLLGGSGSGKTTLLRCINQLETPDSGLVVVNGVPQGFSEQAGRLRPLSQRQIARQRAEVGMVFQRFNLFGHMTAVQNVMAGPQRVQHRPVAALREEAEELLHRVNMGERCQHFPSQLSGGQQQRVAIARALAMKPSVILFDEPTSALDPESVKDVLKVMQDVAATGVTMLVVTHELAFARDVADRIVFLDQGRIVEDAPATRFFENPQHERARTFVAALGA